MKSKRNQRRSAVSPKNKQPKESTQSGGTNSTELAAQFTDEQKAAMIEGARLAYARPTNKVLDELRSYMARVQADILIKEALKGRSEEN